MTNPTLFRCNFTQISFILSSFLYVLPSIQAAEPTKSIILVADNKTTNDNAESKTLNEKNLYVFDTDQVDKLQVDNAVKEPNYWGVALTYRIAEIPYPTTEETVSDIVPLLFFEKGNFFWRGLEAGYTFSDNEDWDFSAIGRYRYFDIPAEFQNKIRGNAVDMGLRTRHKMSEELDIDLEVMSDLDGRVHSNLAARFNWNTTNWNIAPYVNLRWKSSQFNNRYYGLDIESPGSDFDVTGGINLRYHVASNFYLISRFSLLMFGPDTYRDSKTVNTPNQSEVYLGIGFFNERRPKNYKSKYLRSKPYVRFARGNASPSNIGDIIKGNGESDPFNNQLTSVFYGIPVSDTLFGLNIPIYFTGGFVYHHKSEVQEQTEEYVVGIKAYYTVKWPTNWRIGLAEGLSYASTVNYIEQTEMDEKGYRASNLLNYLDFTVDVDLGDLFNSKSLENIWLGYGIHHRSAIFETSSAFGRIKGGSNYTSVYIQYHW